jgi:CheY-like chemotaxis protein
MPEHDSIWAHRILVVEDNRVNQLVTGAMLANLGFSVDVVVDGNEALAAVARTRYRGILMDCQIPGPDGYQATAMIRQREHTGRHIPIIAVTATANPANRQRCLAAGMDDYLGKPLDPVELAAALARCGLRGSDDGIVDPAPVEVVNAVADRAAARCGQPVLDPLVGARLEQRRAPREVSRDAVRLHPGAAAGEVGGADVGTRATQGVSGHGHRGRVVPGEPREQRGGEVDCVGEE